MINRKRGLDDDLQRAVQRASDVTVYGHNGVVCFARAPLCVWQTIFTMSEGEHLGS